MADILKVYEGSKVVGQAEKGEDGTATVTVSNLTANTDYPTGTYKVSFSNENGESKLVDVPGFKTKPQPVSGVTVEPSTLSLEEGATSQISAKVSPTDATNSSVTYSSSDETIATVDNTGLVTAVKAGNADIVATTADGGKTATCKLTVTAKPAEEEPKE